MAQTKEQIKNTYPLPIYNYRVEIDGIAISFSQVSGLNISYPPQTYKESRIEGGKAGPRVMRMPGQLAEITITLQKGVVRGGVSLQPLYEWINNTQINQTQKKDVSISLLDEEGTPVITWTVIDAFPTGLEGPSFDASGEDVAMESLQLTADRITIIEN